jgi:hypothetical protein
LDVRDVLKKALSNAAVKCIVKGVEIDVIEIAEEIKQRIDYPPS